MGRFYDRLQRQWNDGKFVCVGLDPDITKILPRGWQGPGEFPGAKIAFTQYLIRIIDATQDLVCAYKPNTAFFEAYGSEGIRALENVVGYIRDKYPNVVIILDAKRADIGNTNHGTALFAFDHLGCDAITVHPYMGHEAMAPFLEWKDRGVIVLVRTSNEGADELQELPVAMQGDPDRLYDYTEYQEPLYLSVARNVRSSWNHNQNCAVVVGATTYRELNNVRQMVGDLPILIPGVGAQGGSLEQAVFNGKNSHGQGMIINASRSVLYADRLIAQSAGEAARAEVLRMNDVIRSTLRSAFTPPPGNDI